MSIYTDFQKFQKLWVYIHVYILVNPCRSFAVDDLSSKQIQTEGGACGVVQKALEEQRSRCIGISQNSLQLDV